MFKRLKTDYYQVWFSRTKNCAFLLHEDISELSELITFKSRKTTISFTLLNDKDFKVNHCKSLLEITLTVPSMWGRGGQNFRPKKVFKYL